MARRKALSRERVLRAAIVLADEGGIESLSMRKLAQSLGVEAMSLYNHVANKDDILDGIVDAVASEMEVPAGSDWRAAMRETAVSAREAFARHPWAAKLWMSRGGGTARLRHGNALLGILVDAGFSDELTYHAFHIVEGHILGFTLRELSFPFDSEQLPQLAADFLRDFPADQYPHLAEHIKQHQEPHREGRAFELGLDLILDGLERLRNAG